MMKSLNLIQHEFKKWTMLFLPERETNRLKDKVHRKDSVFSFLSDKIFDHPQLLIILKKKIKYWLTLNNSETILALAGYIYYLGDDSRKAEGYFCKCVEKNSENIDNWVDLAFSLYHQGDKKNRMAKAILFNLDLFIKKFKTPNYKQCDFASLKKIYKDFKEEKKDYAHVWKRYIIDEK